MAWPPAVPGDHSMTSIALGEIVTRMNSGEPWIPVPLVSPASIYGAPFQVPQYRKMGDVVHLRGTMGLAGTLTSANTVLFTLPVGYRPPDHIIFACGGYVAARADTCVQCRLYNTGVFYNGEPNLSVYLCLDGVSFYV